MITYTEDGPVVEIDRVWSITYQDKVGYILQKRGHPFRSYKDIKAMAGETHRFLGGGLTTDQYREVISLIPRNYPDETSNQEPVGVSHWLDQDGREIKSWNMS